MYICILYNMWKCLFTNTIKKKNFSVLHIFNIAASFNEIKEKRNISAKAEELKYLFYICVSLCMLPSKNKNSCLDLWCSRIHASNFFKTVKGKTLLFICNLYDSSI